VWHDAVIATQQENAMSRHDDLTMYTADARDDSDASLECYFEDYTSNLWHVYVNGAEIYNLLSDTVIESLEQEYRKHCRAERLQSEIDAAMDSEFAREMTRRIFNATGVRL
jgi:hypothetical protein